MKTITPEDLQAAFESGYRAGFTGCFMSLPEDKRTGRRDEREQIAWRRHMGIHPILPLPSPTKETS